MGKIDLKSITFRPSQPDYRAGDILRKVRQNKELMDNRQINGLVTEGVINVTQGEGSGGWGISDYIEFGYKYLKRPNFTWGQDGSYTGTEDEVIGDYALGAPTALLAFEIAEDFTTYSPAIFIPRVIKWVMESSLYFVGCYLIIIQLNPDSTEVNKKMRLNFRFEGRGISK